MTITKNGDGKGSTPLRIVVWGGATFALLLPLIAMQFTSEVDWDFMDFAVFGVMLLVVCGTYEFATRLTGNRAHRSAVAINQAIVAVIAFFTGWGQTFVLTGFFIIFWLTSAQLFRKAAKERFSALRE